MIFLPFIIPFLIFFVCRAYKNYKKIEKLRQADNIEIERMRHFNNIKLEKMRHFNNIKQEKIKHSNSIELERRKLLFNIILAFLTCLLAFSVHAVEKPSPHPTNTPIESRAPSNHSNSILCPYHKKLWNKPGQKHPHYEHVIAGTAPGRWVPEKGYDFITKDAPCDLRVQRKNKQF